LVQKFLQASQLQQCHWTTGPLHQCYLNVNCLRLAFEDCHTQKTYAHALYYSLPYTNFQAALLEIIFLPAIYAQHTSLRPISPYPKITFKHFSQIWSFFAVRAGSRHEGNQGVIPTQMRGWKLYFEAIQFIFNNLQKQQGFLAVSTPNSKPRGSSVAWRTIRLHSNQSTAPNHRHVGAWNLEFPCSLGFGVWSFMPPVARTHTLLLAV
jgi:hypothetical protein